MKPGMNLRASWTRTIARPTFLELAPVSTEEFLAGDTFVGNPFLVLTNITNYDLRWEWFRRPGEVIAASVFYKELDNPIEYISFNIGESSYVQPINFETGTVQGFEVEARSALDFISKKLRHLSIGFNFTWLDSEVAVPASEQQALAPFGLDQETRRLQGQPEMVGNLNIVYDNPEIGTSVGVFYTAIGETLVTGAAKGEIDGIPNVFESSFYNLDITFGQRINRHWTIKAAAKNVNADDRRRIYRTPQEEEAVKSIRATNSRYEIGATYRF